MPGPEGIESSVEMTEGLVRRLHVTVSADALEREVENRLQAVGRAVALKGYRPGKIPRAVLQQRFGDQARREVIENIVKSGLSEAVRQQNLRPVGEARIDAPTIEKGADLRFSATFEVLPDISLSGLDGIPVEQPEPAIDEGDVDFAIDGLRRQQVQWRPVARAARLGDRVTVNSSGLVDGQQVEGLAGDAVPLVLGAGQFLAEVEREIVGLAAGDERIASVSIPPDFGYADIAGRTVQMTVSALEVAEAVLPAIDGAFARSLGVASGEAQDLRAELRLRLAEEFTRLARADVRRQLFQHLVDANPVPVPRILVDQEAANLKYAEMRSLVIVDPDKARPLEAFQSLAEERVRMQLLMDAIVRSQGITADAERVRQRTNELIAARGRTGPSADRMQVQAEAERDVLEDQVGDWLEQRAAMTPKPMSYRQLVSPQPA